MIESDRMSSSVGSDWQQFTIIRFLAVRNTARLVVGCNGSLPEECYSTGVGCSDLAVELSALVHGDADVG